MSAPTSVVVDRAIMHARRLWKTRGYRWSTARAALAKVLTKLEARGPRDPSLDHLRRFIADGDRLSHPPSDSREDSNLVA